MIKQCKERKPHDHHFPDCTKGSFVVHYRKAGTVRKFWCPKLVEALDFVISNEGNAEVRPEKITQNGIKFWVRKEK